MKKKKEKKEENEHPLPTKCKIRPF
jgi:hypothetical protein